jgi:hypothetical protein
VIEAFVSTDGTNDEGSNELHAPEDIEGFKLMVVRRTMSGKELGSPEFIQLQASDFPGKSMSIDELRAVARNLHARAAEEAPRLDAVALRDTLEESLRSLGWHATHSAQGERASGGPPDGVAQANV